jgi:hypothetical protein
MDIHQLQVSYQMEQDRLLVRLNTHSGEELRLWLTRRMIKNLFPHMIRASIETDAASTQLSSHDGADSRALSQFKKQESLQQADFQTAFKAEANVLPMGSEPLLVTTVHVTPLEAGALRLAFEENSPGAAPGRRFEVILAPPLLHGFMHLLESALKHTDWGLALAEPIEAPDSASSDALATALPPKYLN